jgi:hypothetical protein
VPDSRWDWDTPFDDAFVQAAAAREAPANERIARARRIARGHRTAEAWRSAGPGSAPSARGRMWRGLAAMVAVTSAVVVLTVQGAPQDLLAGRGAVLTADGTPLLPPPPDAAESRLLPEVAPPAGEGGFVVLQEHRGRLVAFDPCRPVHWVVRQGAAPPEAVDLLRRSFAALSAATGLVFVEDGPTDETYDELRPLVLDRYGDHYAPVLVDWSDPAQAPGLADAAGFAGARAVDPDGRGPRYVTGIVVLDVPDLWGPGSSPESRTSVVLHELGHLVGLGHVDDPTDTMHAPSPPVPGFTVGALRGLAQAGRGPCFG